MNLKDITLVSIQFVLILLFFIVPTGYASGKWFQAFAFVITLAGISTTLAAVYKLGKALTPFPTPNNSNVLVISGIYKFIRHPIYTGIFLILCGLSLYSMNIYRAFISILIFLLFQYKSRYEEQLLKAKFVEYETYFNRTGRFFPKLFNRSV